MARLAVPQLESGSMILIDDPTTKNHRLGPKQIEVRCVYLEEILGKICLTLAMAFVVQKKSNFNQNLTHL